MRKITIIGLGLIGGSLGLALKQSGTSASIVGHDLEHESAGKAKRRGAVDQAEWNLPRAVENADVVVLAVPVGAVKTLLGQIADHLKDGCVVTDVSSTKAQVIAWAESILPARVSFVGGHPMAGKEVSGIDSASADLLAGCTYCLCPAPSASEEAVELVSGMARAVGALPLFLDPIEHDSYVAAISHLPYLAAVALLRVPSKSSSWRDILRLAATGFRDTTRIASANPVIYRDICNTNRTNIVHWLDAYIAELSDVRKILLEEGDALEEFLRESKQIRDGWLEEKTEAAASKQDIPSAGDQLKQLMWGNLQLGRRKAERK